MLPPDWSGSTIGNVPIGQGIAVTPIQMAAAYAMIANGGVWVQPHLVEKVGGAARAEAEAPARSSRRRSTSRCSAMLTTSSRTAPARGADRRLHGRRQDRHRAGAGRARRLRAGKYVASFVGFVPASKPRLVVLVKVQEPTKAIWGGTVAAPAFAEIARFCLQYLEIPPDQSQH